MTDEEELARERQIAEIIKIRGPQTDSPASLRMWLNSSVLTAIVTVAGTALLGTWVSSQIQNRSKNNELDRVARATTIERQTSAVTRILELAGGLISATDDLLTTVNVVHRDSQDRSKEDSLRLQEWKSAIATQRDTAESNWRRERHRIGFTLQDVFSGSSLIEEAWTGILESADAFETCTRNWYTENAIRMTTADASAICSGERKALEDSVATLTTAARTAARGLR